MKLFVQVNARNAEPREVETLAKVLRGELEVIGADELRAPRPEELAELGRGEPGGKSVAIVLSGSLVVASALPAVIAQAGRVISAFLARDAERSVTIHTGEHESAEFTGLTREDQQRLVDHFVSLSEHADS